jgi:hypothetical protein
MKIAFASILIALTMSVPAHAGAFSSPLKISYMAGGDISQYDVSCDDGLKYEIYQTGSQWCIVGAASSQCESKSMDAVTKACRHGRYIVDAKQMSPSISRVAVSVGD